MKPSYRNLAIAAGGVLAVAFAARVIRTYRSQRRRMVAQTATVTLHRGEVIGELNDDRMLSSAVACEAIEIARNHDSSQVIEWSCSEHPNEQGRLAVIAAPADRGTELHLSMPAEKFEVKGVVRRLKMLLETGEIATGMRQ